MLPHRTISAHDFLLRRLRLYATLIYLANMLRILPLDGVSSGEVESGLIRMSLINWKNFYELNKF